MGIIGKIVGGTIGLALGGPLGAIAGAALGHAYDANEQFEQQESHPRLAAGDRAQVTFFVAAFSMLAKLAQTDGRVTSEEMASVEQFISRDLNLDPQNRLLALQIFNTALQSPQTFNDFAVQFYFHFQNQPQLLELMMDILMRVAVSDGTLSAQEEALIVAAAGIFNFGQQRYNQLRKRYANDVDRYYAVLGCQREDSDEQIKHQYRMRVSEYHPDKIAAKGLPEEFIKFANEKFREIQEAYEAIRRERGMH